MAVDVSAKDILTAFGWVLGGAIVIIGLAVKNYLSGKVEGTTADTHGKHVILEQAELRDFGDIPKQLSTIAIKLDQIYGQSSDNGEELDRLARAIEESLRISRKLESELEVAKRLREENLLRGH